MTEQTQQANEQTITIDGVAHKLSDFSDQVKRLVQIYHTWEADLQKSRIEAAKNEAAIRQISKEIIDIIKAEMDAKAVAAEKVAAAEAETETAAE